MAGVEHARPDNARPDNARPDNARPDNARPDNARTNCRDGKGRTWHRKNKSQGWKTQELLGFKLECLKIWKD